MIKKFISHNTFLKATNIMKIAIIGGGIGGLLTTDHFDRLGAEVVLFAKEPLGGGVRRMLDIDPTISMEYSWKQLIPLDCTFDETNRIPTIQEYQTLFLNPLIERIRSSGHWKNLSVERVHKRFLRTTENIQNNGSRLKDLFRVVYLQDELEYYEDFDIVIDASGIFRYPCPIGGGSSWAINEKRAEEKNSIFKSWDIFKTLQSDVPSSGLVVGSGAFAAHYCRLFFRTF